MGGIIFGILCIWRFVEFIKKAKKPSKEKLQSFSFELQSEDENISTFPLKSEYESESKKCPFCQEEIKATAVKCKHCGSILSEAVPSRNINYSTPSNQTLEASHVKNIFSTIAIVSGVLSILLPVIISWLTAITGIIMGSIALVRKEEFSLHWFVFINRGNVVCS